MPRLQTNTMTTYHDSHIDLADGMLHIKGYHFPSYSAKHIPLDTIDNVLETHLGLLGKWRIWGAGDGNFPHLRHWYNSDVRRPLKEWALIITIHGSSTQPTITPDDPEALVKALVAAGVSVTKDPERRKIVTGPRHGDNGEDMAVLMAEDEDEVRAGHDVPADKKNV